VLMVIFQAGWALPELQRERFHKVGTKAIELQLKTYSLTGGSLQGWAPGFPWHTQVSTFCL
jgi:hypothetical protein